MHTQPLSDILSQLNTASSDIAASAIVSEDGLAITLAGTPPLEFDQDEISAFSAALFHLGHRAMERFVGGDFERIMVKSRSGYLLAVPAAQDLILTALAKPEAALEPVFAEMGRAVHRIHAADTA